MTHLGHYSNTRHAPNTCPSSNLYSNALGCPFSMLKPCPPDILRATDSMLPTINHLLRFECVVGFRFERCFFLFTSRKRMLQRSISFV